MVFTASDPLTPLETLLNQAVSDGAAQGAIDANVNRQIQTFRWANTAARNAQTGMVAGDLGYQIDVKIRFRYSGTAWVAQSHQVVAPLSVTGGSITGMGSVTFTGSNIVQVQGCFDNSLFSSYDVAIRVDATTAVDFVIAANLVAGTTPDVTANYRYQIAQFTGTTTTAIDSTPVTAFNLSSSGRYHYSTARLFAPAAVAPTYLIAETASFTNAGVPTRRTHGGRHELSSAYSGIRFQASAGALMTGEITVTGVS